MRTSVLRITMLLVLSASVWAQQTATATKKASHKSAPRAATTKTELQALRESIQAQQQQIQRLQEQLDQRDKNVQQMQQQLRDLQATADGTQSKVEAGAQANAKNAEAVVTVRSDVADLRANSTNTAVATQETQKKINELEHPASLNFKGITLTPGGFLAAEALYRTRNENSDVGSIFNNIPFNGSPNSHLSEFRGTGRQSRLSLLAEGKLKNTKLAGYYEMDFLGAAPTANENQSSSFNPRIRQLWGQAAFNNGLSVTAGQTWSLITMNKKGIDPRGEWIPATIDSQYVVGFNWARLWSVRVAKKFSDTVTAAFSVENPQTLFNSLTIPPTLEGFSNTPLTASAGSQLANPPSVNLAPDMIAKVAFDPGWGHYEIKALGRVFRDRVAGVGTNVTASGGVGVGAILPIVQKKADLILQAMAGAGTARYGDSSNVDVTIRPDATLVPVKNLQTLVGLELHPNPKLDWYLYGGDEYLGRAAYVDDTGKGFGYGSPLAVNDGCSLEIQTATSKCQANLKNLWQGTTGFWYRFYKGDKGTVQYGLQYSYTHKDTWTGVGGAPKAFENIIMTSFRYYLP